MVEDEHGFWLSDLRKLYRQCAGRYGANTNSDGRCALKIIFQRLFCCDDHKSGRLRFGMGLRRVRLPPAGASDGPTCRCCYRFVSPPDW